MRVKWPIRPELIFGRGNWEYFYSPLDGMLVHPDDDGIVSHDASHLGLYYHCVRDVIIYFTLSGWNHGVLTCLSEWITIWLLHGFAFKGTDLI